MKWLGGVNKWWKEGARVLKCLNKCTWIMWERCEDDKKVRRALLLIKKL